MKKYVLLTACVAAITCSNTADAQMKAQQTKDAKTAKDAQMVKAARMNEESNKKTFTWTTSSSLAMEHSQKALTHFLNIEFAQAYMHLQEALKADPNFTVVQVLLSNLSFGERKMLDTARNLLLKELTLATDKEALFQESEVQAIFGVEL